MLSDQCSTWSLDPIFCAHIQGLTIVSPRNSAGAAPSSDRTFRPSYPQSTFPIIVGL